MNNAKKTLSNCVFAHACIVAIIDIIRRNPERDYRCFANKEFVVKATMLVDWSPMFDWEEFFVEDGYLFPGYDQHAIIYTFPFPREQYDALFGAVIYWGHEETVDYYTLVRGEKKGLWELYINDTTKHEVVGKFNGDPSKEKFLQMIRNVKGKPSIDDELLSLIDK